MGRLVKNATMLASGLFLMSAAPAPSVDGLGWISGAWISQNGDEWTEELWTAPRAGMLLGTNRSGEGDKATGFEFMRIAADAGGIIHFWASPAGAVATPFRMTEMTANEVVFENPANDYPTRIVYRREGERLTGSIFGPEGANPMSWTFTRPEGH